MLDVCNELNPTTPKEADADRQVLESESIAFKNVTYFTPAKRLLVKG